MPKTIPVRGRITYGGGDWPANGMLYFITTNPAPGFISKPGTAKFGKDGIFAASTFQANDGLIPGEYLINVDCNANSNPMDSMAATNFVPKKFQAGATSGFKVVVPPDSSGPIEVCLEVPKS